MPKPKLITHSGSFHPDDVFATATLRLFLGDKVAIIRTRDPEIIKTGDYVYDVGGINDPKTNRFDHHQTGGAGSRANGVPYAAFGLVWKKFGEQVSGSKEVAEYIDTKLVQPIDGGDNGFFNMNVEIQEGIYTYSVERLIASFNRTWKEKQTDEDKVFNELVEIAKKTLQREIIQTKDKKESEDLVRNAYSSSGDKQIIMLPEAYPWKEIIVSYPEPLFVVYPDVGTGNWCIAAVPEKLHILKNRKDFPKEWGGKRNSELADVAGVPDAVFCHNKLFFAVAKSKEGAVELARLALQS